MVDAPVLFDTNILIDYLNGILAARRVCQQHGNRAISIISWMEVMAGTTAANEVQTRSFLQQFAVLGVDTAVAERAFAIRKHTRIKLPDAIIQATAQGDGRTLFTRNTRDFPPGTPGVIAPYSL
ncbi:type II toxin-antitoxin system VapC family toxin [Silvibacterium dinghuense]|uniref:Ribonuclease VapC n=1 Tax=Silvibacterium dinghuense TaxID=1560006 RepID=A0A4Q1SHL2_9BACT|nr:type II toxin-antitoxin system VapC family toxin [Silvibacterium dinghuense]RXS97046.1 type II toxin-antitoxin system VapC family toxin [Silvibacterium dinghuense]GGG95724.1 ribonuclease VapC [Silvibacterium dinghuense]